MTDFAAFDADLASRGDGRPTDAPEVQAFNGLARELMSRVSDGLRRRSGDWQCIGPDAIEAFTDSVLDVGEDCGARHLSALQARGVSVDALFNGYLPGAALELGRRWEEDEVGFAEVTLGMSRLQRCLRELSSAYIGGRRPRVPPIRALIAAAPGESHVFGTIMIADQLRRIGWQVQLDVSGAPERVLAAAGRGGKLDVIGLSVGSGAVASGLAPLIAGLRRRIGDPSPLIALGGPLAHVDPDLARDCGADVVAGSSRDLALAFDRRSVEVAT